jgi:hypothetical protein
MSADPELNPCGCCEGLIRLTPCNLANPPGLSALVYRVGVHGSFKRSMLAGLAGPGGLPALTTRADDDPSIALCDAAAAMLDVLTFYQERIANEGYLRTATERMSVLELARAIGYELRPGVAASTYLTFELETAPTAPAVVSIPPGVKVQSLPGQDEQPQTFETVEQIEARPEWNQFRPQTFRMEQPGFAEGRLYLKGTATGLKPGDAVLLIGDERRKDAGNENWDFRRVTAVTPVPAADPAAAYTVVELDRRLGSFAPYTEPPKLNPRVYALRLRANLFGHNAPAWNTLPASLRVGELVPQAGAPSVFQKGAYADRQDSWAGAPFAPGTTAINLDAIYSQITLGSWVVLVTADWAEVYAVQTVAEETRTDYTLSLKTTRLGISGENINRFSPRSASVYAQSEELPLAPRPILDPLQGNRIALDRRLPGLPIERTLIVSGKRMRARVLRPLELIAADGVAKVALQPGDSLVLEEAPATLPSGQQTWKLTDRNGFTGSVTVASPAAAVRSLELVPSHADDPFVSEAVVIKEVVPDSDPTEIILADALLRVYHRATVTVYGNVAAATHGETRQEVLGSGDGARAFQSFTLKQKPLTYVSAATPAGAESTLRVRVNDVLWQETPSLYGLPPRERAYSTRIDDAGNLTLTFGDGLTGARLPTGNENVVATYRTGIGAAGMVRAGQLSLLLTRPLGVQKVTNPLAPTGAADPESRDQARQNAPFTVLTLDRIVSLRDFEDFARAFAGIGKAQATWLWDGERRVVHVTIAAATSNGVDHTIDPRSQLFANLAVAMDAARDTAQRLIIASYEPLYFRLKARVLIDPAYLASKVLVAVTAALRDAYAFERRAFGQPAHESEALALIQAVEGVRAVFLDRFHRRGQTPTRQTPLLAARARCDPAAPSGTCNLRPAQLLLLDPLGIDVTETVQ